eukprot:5231390-Pleurochrysis_carterae.AAC.2
MFCYSNLVGKLCPKLRCAASFPFPSPVGSETIFYCEAVRAESLSTHSLLARPPAVCVPRLSLPRVQRVDVRSSLINTSLQTVLCRASSPSFASAT